jgi:hypothetical protein
MTKHLTASAADNGLLAKGYHDVLMARVTKMSPTMSRYASATKTYFTPVAVSDNDVQLALHGRYGRIFPTPLRVQYLLSLMQ